MKKLISLILTAILVFTLMAPVSAVNGEGESYPVIYISGFGTNIYAEKGNTKSEIIYPLGTDIAAVTKETVLPILFELSMGLATDKWDSYCDEICNVFEPIYEPIILSPDGTPKDNSGTGGKNTGKYLNRSRFSGGEVYFHYDWRLSVEESAKELSALIDNVLSIHKTEKVNIVARCLAGNILASYLQNEPEVAEKVDKAVFFIPSAQGIKLAGAIFTGEIELVPESIDTYVSEMLKYEKIIEDPLVSDFLTVMLTIFEQAELLHKGTDFIAEVVEKVKDDLVPGLVRCSYGSFPSFWSMVPAEDLEQAIDFIYNTPELKEEYEGTIEKIRSYYENVQLNLESNLKSLSEEIDIFVISKYNLPVPPLFADSKETSDGITEVSYTSFGATAADFGKALKSDYIMSMSEESLKYLSPDLKIDASTCVLPDTTWFIKNSYHDHFPDSIDVLIEAFLTTENMTVFTDEKYPQFLDADITGEELTPVTGEDKEIPDLDTKDGKFDMLFRFIKVVIQALIRLISYINSVN